MRQRDSQVQGVITESPLGHFITVERPQLRSKMIRVQRKAPKPLVTHNHPPRRADTATGASGVQVIDRPTSPVIVTPPPPAATREQRRLLLRRMPTELTLTTRMLPVSYANQPATGVRPVTEVDSQPEVVDHLHAAPSDPQQPRSPAAHNIHKVGGTLPYAGGPGRSEQRETPTSAAAVRPGPPAPPRPSPKSQHASADVLEQARQQLRLAMEIARKNEHRAIQAELRAAWAERSVPQWQDPQLHHTAKQRERRMHWLRRALLVGFVGLAIGGYFSLLVPVRERVVAQDAMIDQLTQLHEQLREDRRALTQRAEGRPAPNSARVDRAQP